MSQNTITEVRHPCREALQVATTYKIATLNVNGLSSHIRLVMIGDFLGKQEIDTVFVQEVMQPSLDQLRGYVAQINIRSKGRRTAIVTREHIPLKTLNAVG